MSNVFTRKIVRTIGPPGPTAAGPRVWPFRIRRLGPPAEAAPVTPASFRAAIHARLAEDSALAALVEDRIASGRRHQGDVLPAIEFFVSNNVRKRNIGAQSAFRQAKVQIACLASTPDEAEAVAARVEDLFHAVKFTSADVKIRWSKQSDDFDAYAPEDDGNDSGLHRVVSEYVVTYEARHTG